MQTREQVRLCILDTSKLRQSTEIQGGAAETFEKSKLIFSSEAEEKITVRKTN